MLSDYLSRPAASGEGLSFLGCLVALVVVTTVVTRLLAAWWEARPVDAHPKGKHHDAHPDAPSQGKTD